MPIKLEVNVNDFIRSDNSPINDGNLVFAWDRDKYSLVVGIHRGYDDKYDESTGERIRHRHIVEVLSWEQPDTATFDHARLYPYFNEPRVIVPDGTGSFLGVTRDDEYIVRLDDSRVSKAYPEREVKLFDWEKIKDAYEKNDEPTT